MSLIIKAFWRHAIMRKRFSNTGDVAKNKRLVCVGGGR